MEKTEAIKKNSRKNKIILLVVCILVIVVLIIFGFIVKVNHENHNIKEENVLFGLWTIDGNTVYNFEDNEKGTLKLPLSEYKFTYEIKGKSLYINFESEETTDSNYIYSFDNDNLILKGVKGTIGEYVLHRQKS